MRILIVCHAGTGIGLGHLTRALAIARAVLREREADIRFLVQGNSIEHPLLQNFTHHFLSFDSDLYGSLTRLIQQWAPQIVVFDLFPERVPHDMAVLLSNIRAAACKTVAIDGLRRYRDQMDMIFLPSFRCPPEMLNGEGAPVLFGWDCFLLGVRFFPGIWRYGNKVLVLSGGSDVTGLGQSLPRMLGDNLPEGSVVDWVTGPYAHAPVLPDTGKVMFVEHLAPSSLDELMLHTHFAMTVYGVSFFELLYYGVPSVVFSPYGGKDDDELQMIGAEGVALVAADESEAVEKLQALMMNPKLAEALSVNAKQKMAGADGRRFVQALDGLLV